MIPKRRTFTLAAAAAVLVLAAAALAALALAGSTTMTIGSGSSSSLGKQVAISPQGRTLYALSGESTSHLLCKSSKCLKLWPPLTVHSKNTKLKVGTGVHGHLGTLRRSNGMLQVTLNKKPLYRFYADRAKGDANGEGIESFGGTWHAVTATAPSGTTTPTTPATSTPTTPTTPTQPTPPPYGY